MLAYNPESDETVALGAKPPTTLRPKSHTTEELALNRELWWRAATVSSRDWAKVGWGKSFARTILYWVSQSL